MWFPLEALRGLQSNGNGNGQSNGNNNGSQAMNLTQPRQHTVQLLDSLPLVKTLCDTLPEESPVLFVKAIGHRIGATATLLESRGVIVKVRFECETDVNKLAMVKDNEQRDALAKSFTTWLPVEVVAVVTPWE